MEFVILLVFAILCSGLLMVMYQKHSELTDLITTNQDKIKFLETTINPGENDSVLRSRVSNTESRVSTLERQLKTQIERLEEISRGGNVVAAGNAGGVNEETQKLVNHQVTFVNDRVNGVVDKIVKMDESINYLAQKALLMDKGNACVFSSTEECPNGMEKVSTFGFIVHNPDRNLPNGYFMGSKHNGDWDWMHGGLCCVSHGKLPPAQ